MSIHLVLNSFLRFHVSIQVLMSPEEQEKYRQELLNLQVCIIAPQTSYDITPENLYDYDLPPGLVTMRVARTVLNLYRRGGRLTPKSVLKLLRLGKLLFCCMCIVFCHQSV